MMLILVIGIGAASAADISDASDSNSDTSIASPVDSVDGDGFDYAGDSIDMNVSDSSDVLGVGEEEDVIGDGTGGIVFSEAVDGVIVWDDMDYDRYTQRGYKNKEIAWEILDEDGNHIEISSYNDWHISFDGIPADEDGDDYQDVMEWQTECYNDDGIIEIYDVYDLVGLMDDYGNVPDQYTKYGNHTLTISYTPKGYTQSVKIVMLEPKYLKGAVAIDDVITVNITTNDGPGNFTVYVADNIVANGTVNESGIGSVSFEKIYGKNTLKVLFDGVTKKGLKYETTIDIPKLVSGSFTDLKDKIDNADGVLDLPYDFKLNPDEADAFKNGILIEKNITINANGFTINGTSVDGTSARIFDTANYVTLTINNASLVGGGVSGVNGGALRATPYAHLILNNVMLTDNFGASAGGAINLNSNGALTATNVTFKNNNCNNRGGAIFANSNTNLTLINAVFDSNTAKSNGGNIFVSSNVNVIIENSTFKNFYMKADNAAGGAIYVESNSNVAISDSLFENITVEMANSGRWYRPNENNGGVIHCDDTVILNVTGSTFKNNRNINTKSDANSRGIIFSTGSNAYSYITNCVFINNSAQQSGAIYTRNADIIGNLFVNNSATNDYPEIYYDENGKGTISYNAFMGDVPAIRMMKNGQVTETTNWWGTNNPGDNLVRKVNDFVDVNKYIVMSVYNEGNTAYGALTRNSIGDFIENPELVPVRTAIFESSQTVTADTVDAIASAEVTDSQVNITIDGETMTLFMALGNITNIQVVSVENTNVGADGKVYIVLTGDNGPVDGKLTVISNDKACEVEVSNGFAIAEFGSDFDAGEYDIYYIYEGGANYAATNNKTKAEQKFVVSKNDVTITIDRVKNIITFNVTGENGIIPTGTINATVGEINKVFTLSNGIASYNYGNDLGPGVYDVNVTYSGDKNNNNGSLVTTFEILKCDVVITFTNVTNTLTFNVTGTDGLIATGKIIVTLGNSTQTLTLNKNGLASYDFGKVLPAGEYNLTVNYTGDDYYNPGLMEDTFEIVKMTPTIELIIQDINITQGQYTKFVMKVIGDENIATGYVRLMAGDQELYRSSLYNGVRETYAGNNLKAGIYNITVIYEGDGYYYSTEYVHNETLNVLPKITIKAPSEVYSEQAPLIITIDPVDVNGTLIVKMDGVELYFDEISGGYLYLTLSNLEEGEHTFEAYYGGNDKYMPNSATVTTTVSYPELPQWAQQGYDYTNGGQSPYARLNEIMELWNFTADPGSSNNVPTLLIDAEGNVYVAFNRKVTSIYANGTERWVTTPNGRLGGEVLDAHGHIIAPQSGNAFSYLNAADGSCPTPWGTFYEGSSSYAPVIGPDGDIYINYEYSYPNSGWGTLYGDRRWVGIAYWDVDYFEYRGEGNSLVLIEGLSPGSQPHLAPVTIDNAGNLWHTSTSGLRGVAIGTNTVVFQDANIGTKGRAVVDANNIVYAFGSDDQIFAVTAAGILWNTTVTDGSGSTMVVGKDSEYILSINSEGVLYKYDVTNGKETKVYDFETTVSNALMTDANGVIYVGDDDGTFWALTDDGTVLWTFDADSAITARPVMDKNGVIYIYTADNVLYALGFNKENSTISLEVNDTTTVEGLTAIATVNDDATGEVTFILNNETTYSVEIINGTATLVLDTIAAGDYNITAIYAGNYAYNGNETTAKFSAAKVNSTIEIDALDIIYVDTNGTIIITIENATGNVTVKIDGLNDTTLALNDSVAVLVLPVLAEGTYNITAVYEGDETYLGSTVTDEFDVVKYIPELDIDIDDVSVIENATITVTVPNATGTVTVKVNSKEETADLVDGVAVIDLGLFDAGEYNVTVIYDGDELFYVASDNASFTVSKIDTELDADVESGEAFENVIVTVEVDDYATGNITVIIDGKEYSDVISDNVAEITIPGLGAGDYAAEIVYKGNDKVNENSTTVEFTIDKIDEFDMEASENVSAVSAGTITVYLPVPATGNVTIYIEDEEYSANVTNGVAVVEVPAMAPGEYEYTIYYSGDVNYEDATDEGIFVVIKEDTVLNITVGEDGISVELPEDATGYVLVDVNGTGYFAPVKDGVADVKIIGLDAGNYTTTIIYTGDENYNPANATGTYEIPEIIPEDPELEATVENTTITVKVNENATGNVLVDIDGIGYYSAVEDGQAVIEAYGLEDGQSYEAVVTYLGDDVFAPANTTVTVTVPKVEPVDPQADIEVGNETISIDLPEDATGYLLVDVDGVGYYAPVEDGKATVELPELAPGNHTVTVTYTGDAKYASVNTTENITIELKETIISEDLTKIEKAPDRFEATFTDDEGKALANTEVIFEINGQQYKRTTDVNGKASMGINLATGNYTIKLTNPVTGEVKENNITILSRFIGGDLVKYFRNDTQYVLKVLGDDGQIAKAGEIVTFNINGVFYNRTVNETGEVKLNINLPPGEYIITAEYKGCKMANTVTVLPVLTGENIVKKYGEAKPYEVKLVDGQGKPYAGQTISMNINGVFYDKVTDSDGIAKLNINLPVGEYIITATYGYAAVSNTVTVTA